MLRAENISTIRKNKDSRVANKIKSRLYKSAERNTKKDSHINTHHDSQATIFRTVTKNMTEG